ncbi:MAG TPA: DUF1684 domain-containing protein [Robiginitalea sp.]|nr:DUF1684 domain-containing protein [Robiginitalea sp.]
MRLQHAILSLFLALGLVACDGGKRYHPEESVQPADTLVGKIGAVLAFQKKLNAEFRDPNTSPLFDKDRKFFEGLEFFEPDTTYQVWARLVRSPEALPFDMPTSTDRMARERKFGTLYFELKDGPVSLEIYQSPDLFLEKGMENYLFLPFTDKTNGEETYSGGRYIDLQIPKGDSILIDFNQAYNPYCAYNPKFSCPIVPSVNRIDFEIRAGVKDFQK